MKISLISALAENGVIGKEGDLPWKMKSDMRFFVQSTRGHAVIMGRLNYVSMGRPLPGRRNIVISREPSLSIEGCHCVTSVPAALRLAEDAGEDEAWIIGGAQIYALGAAYAHQFCRTTVLAQVPGDVYFPPIDLSDWKSEEIGRGGKDEENDYAFVIERLTRRSAPLPYR